MEHEATTVAMVAAMLMGAPGAHDVYAPLGRGKGPNFDLAAQHAHALLLASAKAIPTCEHARLEHVDAGNDVLAKLHALQESNASRIDGLVQVCDNLHAALTHLTNDIEVIKASNLAEKEVMADVLKKHESNATMPKVEVKPVEPVGPVGPIKAANIADAAKAKK